MLSRLAVAVALLSLVWLAFRRAADAAPAHAAPAAAAPVLADLVLVAVDDAGAPVTQLEVRLEPAASSPAAGGQPPPLDRLVTSAAGRFELRDVPPGRWWLTVASRSHRILAPLPATAIAVPRREPIEVRAEATAALEVLVQDSLGRPVGGAEVRAFPASESGRRAVADAQGRVELEGLPSGFVAVEANRGPLGGRAEAVLRAGQRGTLSIRLPGGRLSGLVVDARGAPVAGARVRAAALDGDAPPAAALTDTAGRFAWPSLPPGALRVWVEGPARGGAAHPSSARAGGDRRDAVEVLLADGATSEVRLVHGDRARGVTARGRLLIGREPVADAELTFVPGREPGLDLGGGPGRGTAGDDGPEPGPRPHVVRTDRQGRYEVLLEHAGPWAVLADLPGRGSAALGAVTCDGDGAVARDLALRTGELHGRLVDRDGRGVAGAAVACVPATPWAHGPLGAAPVRGTTAADGSFLVGGLTHGPWIVHATPAEDALARVQSQPVEVGPAALAGAVVELVTVPAGAVLLRFPGGALDTGDELRVEVRSAAGRLVLPEALAYRGARSAGVRIAGLAPGSYRCAVRAGERVSDWTAALTVTAGGVAEAELALAAGAELRALVRDGSGAPLPAAITLLDMTGEDVTRLAAPRSPAPGRFVLGPLWPGRYALVARGVDGSVAHRTVEVPAGAALDLVLDAVE